MCDLYIFMTDISMLKYEYPSGTQCLTFYFNERERGACHLFQPIMTALHGSYLLRGSQEGTQGEGLRRKLSTVFLLAPLR